MHLDWAVNDELSVSGGLRFESMRYDYRNNMLSGRTKADGTVCGRGGCRYSRPPSGTDEFNNWSANLGAKLVLNDNNNIFMRMARGFRAPQATELYRLQRNQQITDLDSESIDSVELGFDGSINALRYKLTAYHMEKDNVIFRDSDFFNVSDGNTEHQGIELELDYAINAQWSLAVSATQAKHIYLNSASSGDINIVIMILILHRDILVMRGWHGNHLTIAVQSLNGSQWDVTSSSRRTYVAMRGTI
jgi:outer membrane receptor protein involved in Fe transport